MKLKILIILFLALALAAGFYAYKPIKNRYFSGSEEVKMSSEKNGENNFNGQLNAGNGSDGDTSNVNIETPGGSEVDERDQSDNPATGDKKADDCDSECEGLESEELEYCRQICGLAVVKKDSENCDDPEGLKKDYCFKDLAISKKDYEICEKIKDSGIKKTCRNRITEDWMDEQVKSNEAL